MLRGWQGIALSIVAALALFAGVVALAVHHPAKPRGFSGLEFGPMTPGASARTPLLRKGGALVADVVPDSPAEKAKIEQGQVVAAIDGTPVTSARQASDLIRAHRAGDRVTFTVYDITQGEVKPQAVTLVFDAAPPVSKKFSVHPPRTLLKNPPVPITVAANATWSRRLLRGPTIRPLPLAGLGDGQCNVFAPPEWKVAGHAKDNSMFHVMAGEGFQHAIYQSADLGGVDADSYLKQYLLTNFGSPAVLTPPQAQPFGFVLRHYGNQKGAAGFVLYRITGRRIALWLVAVPGGDAGWAKPLVGAVVFSTRCASPGAPALVSRPPELLATRISMRCIQGQCGETDFAASYLTTLRFGYVHNLKGEMFLVRPRRDFWQNGAQGPGFYHQIGGENERLYPGRIN